MAAAEGINNGILFSNAVKTAEPHPTTAHEWANRMGVSAQDWASTLAFLEQHAKREQRMKLVFDKSAQTTEIDVVFKALHKAKGPKLAREGSDQEVTRVLFFSLNEANRLLLAKAPTQATPEDFVNSLQYLKGEGGLIYDCLRLEANKPFFYLRLVGWHDPPAGGAYTTEEQLSTACADIAKLRCPRSTVIELINSVNHDDLAGNIYNIAGRPLLTSHNMLNYPAGSGKDLSNIFDWTQPTSWTPNPETFTRKMINLIECVTAKNRLSAAATKEGRKKSQSIAARGPPRRDAAADEEEEEENEESEDGDEMLDDLDGDNGAPESPRPFGSGAQKASIIPYSASGDMISAREIEARIALIESAAATTQHLLDSETNKRRLEQLIFLQNTLYVMSSAAFASHTITTPQGDPSDINCTSLLFNIRRACLNKYRSSNFTDDQLYAIAFLSWCRNGGKTPGSFNSLLAAASPSQKATKETTSASPSIQSTDFLSFLLTTAIGLHAQPLTSSMITFTSISLTKGCTTESIQREIGNTVEEFRREASMRDMKTKIDTRLSEHSSYSQSFFSDQRDAQYQALKERTEAAAENDNKFNRGGPGGRGRGGRFGGGRGDGRGRGRGRGNSRKRDFTELTRSDIYCYGFLTKGTHCGKSRCEYKHAWDAGTDENQRETIRNKAIDKQKGDKRKK